MTTSWISRRYKPSDRQRVYDLYHAVHGRQKAEISLRNFHWQYESNPCNRAEAPVWVAESDGRIVSLHAAIPAVLNCGGKEERASWSVDLMTHPQYRGKGIFNDLTNKMMKESKQEGVSIFLVLPNRNSGPVLRKRGWLQISSVPHMIKPLKLLSLVRQVRIRSAPKASVGALFHVMHRISALRTRRDARIPSRVVISKIGSFDERTDTLFAQTAKAYDFIVVRKRQYLNWRYAGCKHREYTIFLAEWKDEVLGYIVLALRSSSPANGFIVDFLTKPGPRQQDTIDSLLGAGVHQLRSANAVSIELCAMAGPYEPALRRHGFLALPDKFFWGYDLLAYVEPSQGILDIEGPNGNWFITMGDSDSEIIKG